MNIDYLHEKIKQPNSFQASDILMFKDLTDKYPFTQLYPILYLNALALNKDIHFEDELKRYAYRITDREKLYDMLYPFEKSNLEEMERNDFQEKMLSNEPEQIIESKTEEKDLNSVVANKLIPQEKVSFELDKDSFIEGQETLEKEFLSNIVASSYSLHIDEKNDDLKEINFTSIKSKNFDINAKRTFVDWLKVSEETNQPVSKSKDKIIEKFMQSDSHIDKPKTEFYSAYKKAKESVSESNLVYTETLANILALQGNYPKAIKAFEQLSLTNPEKKRYFAKKIEELNKKINS